MPDKLRIMLVDDHYLVRMGLSEHHRARARHDGLRGSVDR